MADTEKKRCRGVADLPGYVALSSMALKDELGVLAYAMVPRYFVTRIE
jgi:hypothetical protein